MREPVYTRSKVDIDKGAASSHAAPAMQLEDRRQGVQQLKPQSAFEKPMPLQDNRARPAQSEVMQKQTSKPFPVNLNGDQEPAYDNADSHIPSAGLAVQLKSKSWKMRRAARLEREQNLRDRAERHHAADKARMNDLAAAKAKGPLLEGLQAEPTGSATLAHLKTPFVNREMRVLDNNSEGVKRRFLTPTKPLLLDPNAPKRREISPSQVDKYKALKDRAVDIEQKSKDSHHAFYHAQDPRMRVAQDVYRRVYARHHKVEVPEDFHFLRFPGPDDEQFNKHKNVASYFKEDMAAHGMIDDNIEPTKSHLISVNPALHGGLNHTGEETFHYFQIGQGQTALPVANFIKGFLQKFNLSPDGVDDMYKDASALNATKEGSLFQIMVPKDRVDDVAYMAHPHGLPHDDELFDDLHTMGEIRYTTKPPIAADKGEDASDSTIKEPWLPLREKMNDEVTRNLIAMREAWKAPKVEMPEPVDPLLSGAGISRNTLKEDSHQQRIKDSAQQRRTAFLKTQTEALNKQTLIRFDEGKYSPSYHLQAYIQRPGELQHPEGHAQKLRMQTNPDHFGGQGVRSQHELMRIENRSTFMQARMHLSQANTLDPASGISITRHTTLEPKQEETYNTLLDKYVNDLFASKEKS
ncbi:hypothetical protein [Pseudomonas syringae]|uniref:hypothetical protein n=1 Tax=Pseudomonas syringae TaxID=317 RepID=UPI003F76C6DE